jgi:DMSO reductase family type II enzyme heme b subunit
MAGLNGTPMPSYADSIRYLGQNDRERQEIIWGLIYYVKSLETPEARAAEVRSPHYGALWVVQTNLSEGELLNADHVEWDKAGEFVVPITRLWQRDSTNASTVKIKALYNKETLALRMQWKDASMDAGAYRVQDFQDGAAVQFSLTDQPGFQGMGQTSNPCNLWFWRSEWQMLADTQAGSDVRYAYHNRASDADVETYPSVIQEEAVLAGRDAVNPVSLQKISSPVEDLNAKGPGTITSQPPREQNVRGKGVWDGQTWRVVFVRNLKSAGKADAQFNQNKTIPVAFAVWNGMERDRNGQKMVSTWYSLKFRQ